MSAQTSEAGPLAAFAYNASISESRTSLVGTLYEKYRGQYSGEQIRLAFAQGESQSLPYPYALPSLGNRPLSSDSIASCSSVGSASTTGFKSAAARGPSWPRRLCSDSTPENSS